MGYSGTHYDGLQESVIIGNLLGYIPSVGTYILEAPGYQGVGHLLPVSQSTQVNWNQKYKDLSSGKLVNIIKQFADNYFRIIVNDTWAYSPEIQEGVIDMLTADIDQIVIRKFSDIEHVEAIYSYEKDGLFKFYIFIKTKKYDDVLMQKLIQSEIELEDNLLNYKFRFHYVPITVNKADLITKDYNCIFAR